MTSSQTHLTTDKDDPGRTEKSARLSCRIRPAVKEQAEAAARILGQSITDFAETALAEKARTVLAENEHLVFSEQAFRTFLEVLSGVPDQPSEKLQEAVAAYQRHEPILARAEG